MRRGWCLALAFQIMTLSSAQALEPAPTPQRAPTPAGSHRATEQGSGVESAKPVTPTTPATAPSSPVPAGPGSGAPTGDASTPEVSLAPRPEDILRDLGEKAVTPPRPWALGVSKDVQNEAAKLFERGNELLTDLFLVQAAEKYRQALALWDHPGIHYNLALALIGMDDPIAVYEHMHKALLYGADPLDDVKYDHGRQYLALVRQQLAEIDVVCDEPGATVRFDGATLFRAPGRYRGFVRRGEHTLTATKPGFEPTIRARVLNPSPISTFKLRLYRTSSLTAYRRYWPSWIPVMTTVAGGALTGAGIFMTVQAQRKFNEFDEGVRRECVFGCAADDPRLIRLKELREDGAQLRPWAYTTLAVGGATLVTGAVLTILNRPISYRVEPADEVASVAIVPELGPGVLGLSSHGQF